MDTVSKTQRKSNIELLRIIAMLMIIGLHYLNGRMGGMLSNVDKNSLNYYLSHFIESFCIVGVNIFVIITGYFSTKQNKIKIRKILNLYTLTVFYALLFYLITLSVNKFNLKEFLLVFVPFLGGRSWFVETYIILLLLIPFINKIINNMDRNSFHILLVIQILLFSIWYSFLPNSPVLDQGYGIINFITMYLIGAYCKLHLNKTIFSNIFLIFTIFICTVITTFASFVSDRFWGYCFIFNIIGATSIFILFLKVNMPYYKSINYISGCTFAIFLIHIDYSITQILYKNILHCDMFYDSNYFILHFVLSVIFIFFASMFIEVIRRKCMPDYIMKLFDKNRLLNYTITIK